MSGAKARSERIKGEHNYRISMHLLLLRDRREAPPSSLKHVLKGGAAGQNVLRRAGSAREEQ